MTQQKRIERLKEVKNRLKLSPSAYEIANLQKEEKILESIIEGEVKQQDRLDELKHINSELEAPSLSRYKLDSLTERKKKLEDEIEFHGTDKPLIKPIVLRRTFLAIAHEVAATLEQKKIEYGDSFNSVEKLLFYLYPKGINPAQYPNLLSIIRISEKLFRLSHAPDTKDSFTDIAGYSILALLSKENKPKKEKQ